MSSFRPVLACAGAFVFTLGVDLGSKTLAVAASPPLVIVYDHRHVGDWRARVLLSLAAVAAVAGGSEVAARRGLGRLWATWIAVGVLLGGITGNGVSHRLWTRGTPDFIWLPGRYVWNVADFAIGVGLIGIFATVAATALYVAVRDTRRARAERGAAEA
jgi:hypothetical protein